MKNKLAAAFILLTLIFCDRTANAKDVYDIPEVKPILNPLYPAVPEASFGLSYFPVGAFNKHIGIGGAYMTYLDATTAWEVVSAQYFMEMQSGLKKALIETYGASEKDFAVLQYLLKTGYNWVPFYSKSILFNSSLIHSRTFLGVSAGLAGFKIETPPLIGLGFGQNYYFDKGKAVKFAVDYVHFFKSNQYIQDQLTISVGIAFAWGKDE